MKHNPECQKNEESICNVAIDDIDKCREEYKILKSLRFGKKAFDINGHALPGFVPMFLNKGADLNKYNAIMQAKVDAIRRS